MVNDCQQRLCSHYMGHMDSMIADMAFAYSLICKLQAEQGCKYVVIILDEQHV